MSQINPDQIVLMDGGITQIAISQGGIVRARLGLLGSPQTAMKILNTYETLLEACRAASCARTRSECNAVLNEALRKVEAYTPNMASS